MTYFFGGIKQVQCLLLLNKTMAFQMTVQMTVKIFKACVSNTTGNWCPEHQ